MRLQKQILGVQRCRSGRRHDSGSGEAGRQPRRYRRDGGYEQLRRGKSTPGQVVAACWYGLGLLVPNSWPESSYFRGAAHPEF